MDLVGQATLRAEGLFAEDIEKADDLVKNSSMGAAFDLMRQLLQRQIGIWDLNALPGQ